ncbi:hypothetical protein HA402_009150 [Bradysia odoriphaga]|nr:hypothetical protein HA402_009150 [Bradysia odoriphaga]
MLQIVFPVILLVFVKQGTYCTDYYSIIGSKTLKPNSEYAVVVSLHNAATSSFLKLTIQNDKSFKLTNTVLVPQRSSKVVQFSIGNLDEGNYKLIAESQTGLTFTKEISISLPSKNLSVLIQTDKAMYKPGDKVKFRVLVLNSDTNPTTINNMNVFITDGTNNRIKQWTNVDTVMGIFVEELQLSTNPPLGLWNINVDVDNQTRLKAFEVAEYVLPKFEVTVTAPKDLIYTDRSVRLAINAKYTYGGNVKGTTLVSITSQSWTATPSSAETLIERKFEINGNGYVEFLVSELKVSPLSYQDSFDVKASVTESLTGKVLEGDTTMTIRRSKFKITNLDSDRSYTPGYSFALTLQFSYHDGSPFVNTNAPVKISYGPNFDKSNTVFLKSGTMDSRGVATFGITLPSPSNTNGFYVFVSEKHTTRVVCIPNRKVQLNFKEARIILIDSFLSAYINDLLSVEITSSQPLTSLNYLLSSRGKLILSAKKDIPNKSSFTITFTATFDMVPSGTLVAYYIAENGDVISTNIQVPVTGLNNFVKLQTSAAEKQPGEKVNVIISTKPSSKVCLLGVDQSVVLLKSGNDIIPSDVYAELGTYNNYFGNISPPPIFRPLIERQPNAVAMERSRIWPPRRRGGWVDFNKMQRLAFQLFNFNFKHLYLLAIVDDIWRMPMMAMAGAAAPPPEARVMDNQQLENALAPIKTRKYFPETWLWNCDFVGSGNLTIPQIVPDTITSWYLTAFATNTRFGLGVTDDKTVFKVFKSFFISLNLPYSVKRGETIALSIVVFNYMSEKVTARVTLDNSRKEFEFVDPISQAYKNKGCRRDIELYRTKNINVPSNDGAQLSFLITPLIVGPMTIKVTAISPIAGDAIEVMLLVVPEGVTQYKNKAKFIDLRKVSTYTTDFTVDVPSDAVKESTQLLFSLIGDIMGVTLKNIQSLIKLPSGCGEQTMIGLAPDVVILSYLTKVGRLTGELKKQLINYLEVGYQGELCYLHPDGSFSAFGKSDGRGSTWLTAFVVRIFVQASEFITIDSEVITKALEWLKNLQKSDGSFSEVGRVIHSDMQGQATKGVALTAYVAIAFAQNEVRARPYADVISKALNYVKTMLEDGDTYSLAIACYAAQLANHSSKTVLMQKLDRLAIVEGDLKYWQKVKLTTPSDPWFQPPSVNVEITSYALLSYIKAGRIIDGLPVMRWMLSQQSSTGGFSSTQDTVVGITALATFAGEISGGNAMSCSISFGSGHSTIKINKENSLVLQSVELPRNTKLVSLTCTGSGFSLAQLTYQFNLNTAEMSPRFKLKAEVSKNSNDYHLVLNICTSFIPAADGYSSNMAVIEAELPTGFVADFQSIQEELKGNPVVKKTETKNGNTVVVIYLDNVGANEICLELTAYRMCQIADEKPVSVQVYDYYDNSRRRTVFYQTRSKDLCGICADEECRVACLKPMPDFTCPK